MPIDFVFAGSSFYIGTVKSVNNLDAITLAKYFFKSAIVENKLLAVSLWESQWEDNVMEDEKIYVCIGCHFQKFSFIDKYQTDDLEARLLENIFKRRQRITDPNVKKSLRDRHTDILKFLIKEYIKYYPNKEIL